MTLTRRHHGAALRAVAGNATLLRVVGAYALFIVSEYSVWVAMLVYAYGRGGSVIAGAVALAQLLPAALLAPVFAALAERRSPAVLLAGGYLVQAAAMGGAAAAIAMHVPAGAYAAAITAATAVTTTRPAQSTLIPGLAATPNQLTAANVIVGWAEAGGLAVAGSLTGVLISSAGIASVFAVCAALTFIAVLFVARIRVPSLAAPEDRAPQLMAGLTASMGLALRQPRLRLLVALLTAQATVIGALDLLFVILAITILGRGQAWAGYLNSAFGLGAILAGLVGVLLVGRRLGPAILAAALVLSGAIAVLAGGLGAGWTVALLIAAGAGQAVLGVASRSLLQRSVPAELLGRIFGLLEALTMGGLALGAVLVPVLMHLGGSLLALLGVAAVLPAAGIVGGRGLFRLDASASVPVVQIALLRSMPLFGELPAPALEGLAAALMPVEVPAGAVLIRQGVQGDTYYAIAAGDFDVVQDGRVLRRCSRGEGAGEIALLRAVPRTASVVARTDALVYELGRESFLTAVLGHAGTHRRADSIAAARTAGGPESGPGPPAADAAG